MNPMVPELASFNLFVIGLILFAAFAFIRIVKHRLEY